MNFRVALLIRGLSTLADYVSTAAMVVTGHTLTEILDGILSMQTYLYFQRYRSDSTVIRLVVRSYQLSLKPGHLTECQCGLLGWSDMVTVYLLVLYKRH
jgi:hypothetical protein